MLYQLPNGSYIALTSVSAIHVQPPRPPHMMDHVVSVERGAIGSTSVLFGSHDAAQLYADALAKAVNEAKAARPPALSVEAQNWANQLAAQELTADPPCARLNIGFGESG